MTKCIKFGGLGGIEEEVRAPVIMCYGNESGVFALQRRGSGNGLYKNKMPLQDLIGHRLLMLHSALPPKYAVVFRFADILSNSDEICYPDKMCLKARRSHSGVPSNTL